MANQEHLDILKQGAEAWNKWRMKNPAIRPDLSGADLSGANLGSTNLVGANLGDANLNGAVLDDANLNGTDLSSADITGANLSFTFRDYWKIDGIKCDYIFWDLEGEERTPKNRNFEPGEFERLYRWRPLDDFERLIERTIEFPPEYKQAGVSILNYFSEILNKKYPETNAKVQIQQDGLKVSMIIDPAEGKREVIEKALNDYGLVITGKMTPEEYVGNNPLMLIELKSQLNIAQIQIENQKLIIGYQDREIKKQDIQIETLFSIVGNAVQSRVNITNIGGNAENSNVVSGDKNKINSSE